MKIPGYLIASLLASLTALAAPAGRTAAVSIADSPPGKGVLAANTAQSPALTVGLKNDEYAAQAEGLTFNVLKPVTLDKLAFPYLKAESGVPGAVISILVIRLNGTNGSVTDLINKAEVMSADRFTLPESMPDEGCLIFDLTDITLPPSSLPYGFVIRFEDSAPWRILTLVRANDDIDRGGLVTFHKEQNANFVFRSDNGGTSYYNLGSQNMPQFSLLGKTASGSR